MPLPAAHLRIRRGLSRVPAASCEIATAPAEPRNDKLGSAFFPCHCEEGASPTRQSREGSCEFAGGLPMLRLHPARLPRLLRSLAMTNLGVPSSRVIARRAQARRGNLGKAVANSPGAFPCSGRCCEIATAPAEPRNDKLGSAFFPCHCEEGASPTRQSREGSCEFAGGLPMLRLHPARLPRLLRSLAMTNLGAFLIRRGAVTSLEVRCRVPSAAAAISSLSL